MKVSTRFIVSATVAVTLVAGGLAYAFWSQNGTGSGSSSTATPLALTVNQTGSPTGLYPGGPAAALSGTFTNPNAHAVHVSSVSAVVHPFASHLVDAAQPDCTQADFAIGGAGTGAIVVPAGPGVVGSWSGLTVRLLDGAANQDNCKGATITVDYTANP